MRALMKEDKRASSLTRIEEARRRYAVMSLMLKTKNPVPLCPTPAGKWTRWIMPASSRTLDTGALRK